MWLSWRVAEAAGGDVVRAATAEAAEALRGGTAAQHGVAAWRHCMAAWRLRRCRVISRDGEPGTTGACYGCALDASGASGPRARVRACG